MIRASLRLPLINRLKKLSRKGLMYTVSSIRKLYLSVKYRSFNRLHEDKALQCLHGCFIFDWLYIRGIFFLWSITQKMIVER